MTVDRDVRMESILVDIGKTLNKKGNTYRKEPADFIDVELLHNMIIIKGYRAREAATPEKRIDELRDAACYAILAIEREMRELGEIPPDPAE